MSTWAELRQRLLLRYDLAYYGLRRRERFYMWIARHMPKEFRVWVVAIAWATAWEATGKHANDVLPTEMMDHA